MNVQTTPLPGLFLIEPRVFADSRGYFYESYNEAAFAAAGIHNRFVQDNQSQSSYGVIRGLHFQLHPYAQAKLIRALEGRILDVVVDIRKGSPTYGQHYSVELSADNKKQLFIPAGFAHGFSVLSPTATILYKCDHLYHKESEGGVRYDDPAFGIDWGIDMDKAITSDRDRSLPLLRDVSHNFTFDR
ncbi:dTDP-4-dehydrorhamnose 3,5-epimerase [Flaviaesturariibacter aridisoli]|uniref:dTDP-4-dehydrorhamnose 3,5-epimerase n=1 Tax=Flaviaesturariibacter aridisoli TaxID=2545761 RepID=A0A4R4E2Q4_9BACT|nr:dTDP-4-dehydrorhamnose 3,5-epimerase [Flaviaesturariibacter aridisoli]TCZ72890.1 dTDP-4-dehydrorhamnose 3,5-epimerase [Flaviaesturariibacter aridisoli]